MFRYIKKRRSKIEKEELILGYLMVFLIIISVLAIAEEGASVDGEESGFTKLDTPEKKVEYLEKIAEGNEPISGADAKVIEDQDCDFLANHPEIANNLFQKDGNIQKMPKSYKAYLDKTYEGNGVTLPENFDNLGLKQEGDNLLIAEEDGKNPIRVPLKGNANFKNIKINSDRSLDVTNLDALGNERTFKISAPNGATIKPLKGTGTSPGSVFEIEGSGISMSRTVTGSDGKPKTVKLFEGTAGAKGGRVLVSGSVVEVPEGYTVNPSTETDMKIKVPRGSANIKVPGVDASIISGRSSIKGSVVEQSDVVIRQGTDKQGKSITTTTFEGGMTMLSPDQGGHYSIKKDGGKIAMYGTTGKVELTSSEDNLREIGLYGVDPKSGPAPALGVGTTLVHAAEGDKKTMIHLDKERNMAEIKNYMSINPQTKDDVHIFPVANDGIGMVGPGRVDDPVLGQMVGSEGTTVVADAKKTDIFTTKTTDGDIFKKDDASYTIKNGKMTVKVSSADFDKTDMGGTLTVRDKTGKDAKYDIKKTKDGYLLKTKEQNPDAVQKETKKEIKKSQKVKPKKPVKTLVKSSFNKKDDTTKSAKRSLILAKIASPSDDGPSTNAALANVAPASINNEGKKDGTEATDPANKNAVAVPADLASASVSLPSSTTKPPQPLVKDGKSALTDKGMSKKLIDGIQFEKKLGSTDKYEYTLAKYPKDYIKPILAGYTLEGMTEEQLKSGEYAVIRKNKETGYFSIADVTSNPNPYGKLFNPDLNIQPSYIALENIRNNQLNFIPSLTFQNMEDDNSGIFIDETVQSNGKKSWPYSEFIAKFDGAEGVISSQPFEVKGQIKDAIPIIPQTASDTAVSDLPAETLSPPVDTISKKSSGDSDPALLGTERDLFKKALDGAGTSLTEIPTTSNALVNFKIIDSNNNKYIGGKIQLNGFQGTITAQQRCPGCFTVKVGDKSYRVKDDGHGNYIIS